MSQLPLLPKWPHRFFQWYCRVDRYEELHGDLEEMYYERYKRLGPKKAKWLYLVDVIRCCQPYAWNNKLHFETNYMIRNYLTISLRVIKKNPLSSFINLFGLSLAIGICVLVYAFSNWVLSKDDFHTNKNNVFLVTHQTRIADNIEQVGESPKPLADLIKNNFLEIKNVCSIDLLSIVIKKDENIFREQVQLVDPSYLEMFTFPLKWGQKQTLRDMNSIILSEEMANKYFGSDNPIGRELQLIFTTEKTKLFKVTGVAKKFPEARSFSFDFLISNSNNEWISGESDKNDWTKYTDATFIQVSDQADLIHLKAGIDKFKELYNQSNPDAKILSFSFEPLVTLYENAAEIRGSLISKGYSSNVKAIYFLLFIALLMLALSCFNYINIAIVSSSKRLKEIGVRKTIGATINKVTQQFLIENATFTLLSLFIGVIIGCYVIIPWFQMINDFTMDFSLIDPNLWLFLLVVLIFTSLFAGLYPSLVISKFQTANIFRGAIRYSKQGRLTKFLLGFQIVMACILIVSAFMFTYNSLFLAKQDWGYNPKGIVYSIVDNPEDYLKLRDQMQQYSNVAELTGGTHHIGVRHTNQIITYKEEKVKSHILEVANNYLQTLELVLSDGRFFNLEEGSDKGVVVINEKLKRLLNLKSPIGESIEIKGEKVIVIGIIKDFRYFDFDKEIEPTAFRVSSTGQFNVLAIRASENNELQLYRNLKKSWASLFPETPFNGGFQEDVWGTFFTTMELHGSFWRGIALAALLLASLGLYGLVSLNVAGRKKEFSIKMVLGAGLISIYKNIVSSYLLLYLIALLVGGLLSYYTVDYMLDAAYLVHAPISLASIILAVIALLLVLLFVVGGQVWELIKHNPVKGLKSE